MTINTQTGTAYTLVATDEGKLIVLNNAAAITLTIPINSAVPFPLGTRIDVYQAGVGQVTFASTATIRNPVGLKIKGQYGEATLTKVGTDEWILAGYITA